MLRSYEGSRTEFGYSRGAPGATLIGRRRPKPGRPRDEATRAPGANGSLALSELTHAYYLACEHASRREAADGTAADRCFVQLYVGAPSDMLVSVLHCSGVSSVALVCFWEWGLSNNNCLYVIKQS